MLDKMRATFLDMFSLERIEKAKPYSLSKEFRTEVKAIIVILANYSYIYFKYRRFFLQTVMIKQTRL